MEKQIDLTVIDRMFSAVVAANESEQTLKNLRPQAEDAVKELLRPEAENAVEALIREQGKPADFTGIIEYHGFKIRVQRPKSYAWEDNNNEEITSDPNHAIYMQQMNLQKSMNAQLKYLRAQLKATAEALADAHPNSKSIKRGFTIAFV